MEALDKADRNACFEIRIRVFCEEQGVSRHLELDGQDDHCRHFLALGNSGAGSPGLPVGTARMRPLGDGVAKLERIAVLPHYRGQSVGRLLVEQTIAAAIDDGHLRATMHAQSQAKPFYEKLGFIQTGPAFMEAGMPHVRMDRALTP